MISIERVLQALVYLAALMSVTPLFLFLDPFTQVVFCLALGIGIICDRRRHYWMKPLPATLLTIIFFFVYLIQISKENVSLPVVNLLVLLLSIRLVSEKQGRHILQIFVLTTFGLAGSTLLSLSSFFFISLVTLVLLVTCGLVLLSFYGAEPGLILSRRQWRLLMSTGLLLPTGSLMLMLVLFLILPRTQYPLWNFLNTPARSSIGFSEQVRPGSFAELSETKQIALRVEMEEVAPANLYWRGIVLNRIDGTIWRRDSNPPADRVTSGKGEHHRQEIFIEAKMDRFLPVLEVPTQVQGLSNRQNADTVYTARRALRKQTHYSVLSSFGGMRSLLNENDQTFYLQLPSEVSPRVSAVVAEITSNSTSTADKVSAIERFFFSQNLIYTSTGLTPTHTPVETFLFESKQGYCEYFASSFALLLRLSGVPARLVGGYMGGDYNELGGYYLVSEDLAHVWVEALDDNGRWQKIDPSRYAVNGETALGSRGVRGAFSLRVFLDTLDYYWTRMVISYDLSSQFQLLKKVGSRFELIRKIDINAVWKTLLLPVLLALTIWGVAWFRKRPKREERLLKDFQRLIGKKYNIDLTSNMTGLFDLARRTNAPLCQDFADHYGRVVYHDRSFTHEDYKALTAILQEIRSQRAGK